MKYGAILFDFDGVLLESEYAGNKQIADWLTANGHPATPEQSMEQFMGLAGRDFHAAIERHIGLRDAFGDHLYSGREHVARGKPAADLYLHAAAALGVAIADCAIIEDSVVGATGAVASGGYVIGVCAGRHCDVDHADRLRAVGVRDIAADFAEVARLLG